jgi:hypothetical protein
MSQDLARQFSIFKAQQDDKRWTLDITPNWEIPLSSGGSGEKISALIGGIVSVARGKLELYSFTLCLIKEGSSGLLPDGTVDCSAPSCCLVKYPGTKRVFRKFHFDIDAIGKGDRPVSHLQYGGEFPKKALQGPIHYCLDHGIEKPRLPYQPMDFVLLLDILISQYDSLGRLADRDWTSLVVESERMMQSGYFREITDHFSSSRTETLLGLLSQRNTS